eukprot:TRINITY_DN406_c0_g2_i13.p1 TRINITY_DN406_c0_g2~~TRINITY_DN406_c0_g2_i13.p1  ORF type:complete len:260 (-),score=43.29 TRINITY_DN406_c0_g2_i13:503-1282(-)
MFARAVPVAFDDEGVGVVSRYSGGIRTQLHRPIGPLEYGFRSYQQGHDETQPPRRSISVQQSEVRSNPDLGSTKKRVPCELTRFSSGLDWNSTRRHVEQPINRGGPSATGKRMIFGDEKAIHQVLDFTHSERRHGYVHEAPTLPGVDRELSLEKVFGMRRKFEEKFKSNRPIPFEASSTGNLHTHEPFSKQESPFKSPFRFFVRLILNYCSASFGPFSSIISFFLAFGPRYYLGMIFVLTLWIDYISLNTIHRTHYLMP